MFMNKDQGKDWRELEAKTSKEDRKILATRWKEQLGVTKLKGAIVQPFMLDDLRAFHNNKS